MSTDLLNEFTIDEHLNQQAKKYMMEQMKK
jgi:hypothetical protein